VQVGVAFTRFQTRYFQDKYGNLDATVISYGPCQTPTLNFAVEQHQRIVGFEPEPFWVVAPQCSRDGGAEGAYGVEPGQGVQPGGR
jgi:DNA topoisomerase III